MLTVNGLFSRFAGVLLVIKKRWNSNQVERLEADVIYSADK